MSTSRNCPFSSKKLSSCVRPGVRDMRASVLRPVSALISDDLPTLERPATAISGKLAGGSPSIFDAPQMNSQGPANRRRPDSRKSGSLTQAYLRCYFFFAPERAGEIVPELELHAGATHDEALLGDGEQVVPGPVDDEARWKRPEHEGEDDRHVSEHLLLHGVGRLGIHLHLNPHRKPHDDRPDAEPQERADQRYVGRVPREETKQCENVCRIG